MARPVKNIILIVAPGKEGSDPEVRRRKPFSAAKCRPRGGPPPYASYPGAAAAGESQTPPTGRPGGAA